MSSIYILPYTGLGDTIYQRPFVRAVAERNEYVYIRTPWPEIFVDIPNVRPVMPQKDYRTQTEHMKTTKVKFWPEPNPRLPLSPMGYEGIDLATKGIIKSLEAHWPLVKTPFIFDLPAEYNECPVNSKGKPIAILRPPTIRSEWPVPARNTMTMYIEHCAKELKKRGYYVISLAHLKPGLEWLTGPLLTADAYFHKGELKIPQLIGLMRHASIAVGNSGWIVPMAMATKTPLFIVWGGRGGFDNHNTILDPRMDMSKVGWVYPDNFCSRCLEDQHTCEKLITKLPQVFNIFLDKLNEKHSDTETSGRADERTGLAA